MKGHMLVLSVGVAMDLRSKNVLLRHVVLAKTI